MNALNVKIAVSLMLLFGLGTVTGLVAARKLAPRFAPTPARVSFEERWTDARLEEFRTRLNLTPTQVTAITPHFRQFGQEMRQLREDAREHLFTSLRDLNENIARDLTPQQRLELRRLAKERWQRHDPNTP
jgi:Spy/CpxP family protein refolding chaperone